MIQHRLGIYKTRFNYWSCTNFADWIRGKNKLNSGTMEEWDLWKKTAKKEHPFRYWVAEEFLDNIQDTLLLPADIFREISRRFKNRFYYREFQLTSNLPRWEYYDLDTRILNCLFDELVRFVEGEKAHMQLISGDIGYKRVTLRPWKKKATPEMGTDYLRWEIGLRDGEGNMTEQAKVAQEILKLYLWWKFERPERPDPWDISGLTEYYDNKRNDGDDKCFSASKDPEWIKMHEYCNEIEAQYDNEDEEKMIELIKIRKGLWT